MSISVSDELQGFRVFYPKYLTEPRMSVTKEMEKIIKEKLAGKITHEQLIALADAIARHKIPVGEG